MVPVVATRLRPPTRAGVAVPRETLPVALAHLRGRRLLLVRAPAGYGKSLLMAQLYDALRATGRGSVAWVSAGDIGGSLHEVVMHCATALAATVPGLKDAVKNLLAAQINASPESISALLCNELELITDDLYLFVDDLHALAETPAERFFECLLRDAPGKMHFAIASRSELGFSIARLRAHGDLGEVDAETLRFSSREAQFFLENSGAALPNAELIELACKKTEGWAAGLQLLSLSVGSAGDWAERLHGLSGGNRAIGAFLAEDVFSAQSEDVQRFLMQSSVLRQFSRALCDDVGQRSDSQKIIRQLQRQGLFIFSLDQDDQWYRYHHLFAQFLQKRLSETHPLLVSTLHHRAAQWFRANGMLDDAMFHAFASREFGYAASILDEACNDLFYQGQLLSLMAWVEQIPERVLNEYPKIQLIRVWNLTLEWRFEEVARILASVLKRIRAMVDAGSLSPESASRLHCIYQHRKMMLALFTDDMRTVERLCLELLVDFPDDDQYLRGSVELCILAAQREQYRLDAVGRLDAAARGYFERAGSVFVLIWHESILGPALFQRGDLKEAASGYRSAIAIAHRIAGHPSPLGAMPAVLLAELLMECGEYDEARSGFDQYLPLCAELGLVDHLVAAYVGRARLAALYSESETAYEVLTQATRFASARCFERLFWHATAEKIRQAARRNDLDCALRIANEAKLPRESTALYPVDQTTTTRTEAMAVAWIRLALARGFAKEAETLAKRWLTFATKHACVRTEIRMGILVAAAKFVLGDQRGATRALIQALGHAVPRGMVLAFLEEGEAVKQAVVTLFDLPSGLHSDVEISDALREAFKLRPDLPSIRAQAKLEPAGGSEMLSVSGRLSQREINILEFVSQGLQNKEIAERLGLAEGSVKWYMQQIYAKLGVRRRLKAFQKAKALGLVR